MYLFSKLCISKVPRELGKLVFDQKIKYTKDCYALAGCFKR